MDLQEDERPAEVESPPSVKESGWMNQKKSSSKYDPIKMLKIAISNINPYLANLKRQKWIYNMILSLEWAFSWDFALVVHFLSEMFGMDFNPMMPASKCPNRKLRPWTILQLLYGE